MRARVRVRKEEEEEEAAMYRREGKRECAAGCHFLSLEYADLSKLSANKRGVNSRGLNPRLQKLNETAAS